MPPHGPASGEDTAPDSLLAVLLKAMHTDHLDGSLPAHRRGTLRGYKDVLAACPRWWAGKGPCSKLTASRARCPHRLRDTPSTRPWGLGGGIHAATRSRDRRGHRTRQFAGCFTENHACRPSRQVLARSPSRDLTRHGCRARAY
ncbi:hypothetical protein EIP98_07145 [Xanthomonas campestris pv. raphani]